MVHLTLGLLSLMWAHASMADMAAPEGPDAPWAQAWQDRQQICVPAALGARAPSAPCSAATEQLVAQMAAAHWPGAWAFSDVLAHEALQEPDGATALARARAAVVLNPQSVQATQALVRALWRHHAYGEALGSALGALTFLSLSSPAQAGARALLLYALLTAAQGCFALLALWAAAIAGPQLSHDIGHRLPQGIRGALVVLFAALSWGLVGLSHLGVILASAALCGAVLLHMSAAQRSRIAVAAVVLGVLLSLLPQMATDAAFAGSPEGARYRSLEDANACWARARLPAPETAVDLDIWAQALLARRGTEASSAEALVERAIAAGQMHPTLLVLEGNLLWERQDFARARAFYEQALLLRPDDAVAQYNLSLALLSLADPRAAEAARSRAFASGGPKLTALVARAQAAGQLLLDPEVPEPLRQPVVPLEEAAPVRRLARAALGQHFLQGHTLPCALLMLFALAVAHGIIGLARVAPSLAEWAATALPLTGRCSRCHALSCPRCAQGAWEAGLCAPCHRAVLGADDNAQAVRNAQEAVSMRHYRISEGLRGIATWLCPGVGVSLQRSTALGLMLTLAYVSCIEGALWGLGIWPLPLSLGAQALPSTQALLGWACTTGAACLWIIGFALSRQER